MINPDRPYGPISAMAKTLRSIAIRKGKIKPNEYWVVEKNDKMYCSLCGKEFSPLFNNGVNQMIEHGMNHLKECGLLAFI